MDAECDTGLLSKISKRESKCQVEWTVENFLSYSTVENRLIISPEFPFADSFCLLGMLPNGTTKKNSMGWVSVYLCMLADDEDDSTPPRAMNYRFGVKKADGSVEQMGKDLKWVFENKEEVVYGCHQFLKRSELEQRRLELVPSDAFTITCSLREIGDDFYSTSTSSMNTFRKNLEDMFLSRKFSDATLKVQHEEFPVHKCILAAQSQVFAAMFESDAKEKNTGVVDILDCDPVEFRCFLGYLYSGKVKNLPSNVFKLYRIAAKYIVEELKFACVFSIMLHLTVGNVCDAAILGDEFDEESLTDKIKLFFNKNYEEIVCTANWKSLCETNNLLANELLNNMTACKDSGSDMDT